ncbi:MAG: hypothetical protein LC749_20810, partial [Actinobacteria bacterium]|nr:hypothetical protein [Actinomycetota bacterium]
MRISRRNNGIGAALALLILGSTIGAPAASAVTSVPTNTTPPPVVHFPTKTPNAHPNKISHGPDGAVWFTEINNASIARMTGSGFTQEFPVPDPNQFLRGITDGPDGAMWFAEEGTCVINPDDPEGDCLDFTDGKIGRIT